MVYFRAGYEPGHYPTELEWEARLRIERSRAIKCPSIQYHLAGTKKVQQSLAKPMALEHLLDASPDKLEAVREIFTGLYSLDQVVPYSWVEIEVILAGGKILLTNYK